MPQELEPFQLGDRVMYQRPGYPHHSLNGATGVVIEVGTDETTYRVRWDRPDYMRRSSYNALRRNLTLVEKVDPFYLIQQTIYRLEKRQHFYQHIGRTLDSWKHLESV